MAFLFHNKILTMQNKLLTISIFIILIISSNNTLTGQRKGLTERQANTLDIMCGGDFSIRLISGDESILEVADVLNKRTSHEKFRLSSRFGINYYHGIGKRFSIKTGIRFANPGFSIASVEEIDPEQNINGIEKAYQTEGFHYQYKYQMIAVPLGLKYILNSGTCKPYVEFGVSTNFYQRTTVERRLYKAEKNQLLSKDRVFIDEPISQINYFGFISTGGDFVLSENIHGFSQIIARYQFNNLRPNSLISEKIVNLGMELGVRYIFRK